MSEWKRWPEAWPNWKDAGRPVEVKYAGGCIVSGKLCVDDQFFNGEDEVPIFTIKSENGEACSFADNEEWRFI